MSKAESIIGAGPVAVDEKSVDVVPSVEDKNNNDVDGARIVINSNEYRLCKISLLNDVERCTVGDLLSFVFFLMILLAMDQVTSPNTLICGFISLLFTCFFVCTKRYVDDVNVVFTVVSAFNGITVLIFGIFEVNAALGEIYRLQEGDVSATIAIKLVELIDKLKYHRKLHFVFLVLFGVLWLFYNLNEENNVRYIKVDDLLELEESNKEVDELV